MAQFTLLHRTRHTKPIKDATDPVGNQMCPLRLTLRLADSNRLLSTPLADRLVIGRGGGSYKPDIDLSLFDGMKRGVSRWHAVFTYVENNLFVEDLNSTNGTRINGYQIDGGRAYRLRNGDELELGSLRMMVYMVRPPG